MYNYAGEPWKTQKYVRDILKRIYVGSDFGQGYIGDEDNGIESGTPFEDLPYEWTCPICNATKESFEEVIE